MSKDSWDRKKSSLPGLLGGPNGTCCCQFLPWASWSSPCLNCMSRAQKDVPLVVWLPFFWSKWIASFTKVVTPGHPASPVTWPPPKRMPSASGKNPQSTSPLSPLQQWRYNATDHGECIENEHVRCWISTTHEETQTTPFDLQRTELMLCSKFKPNSRNGILCQS